VCVAALLSLLVPQGSILGFLAELAGLGVAITFVVVGYVWICEKCEDYLSGHLDRLLSMDDQTRRKVASMRAKVERPQRQGELGPPALPFPRSAASEEHYLVNLRSLARPIGGFRRAASAEKRWHGQ
jgi:hypothetical protein